MDKTDMGRTYGHREGTPGPGAKASDSPVEQSKIREADFGVKSMKTQKKLLVVDDSELNRAILGELFGRTYEILEAENGLVAIQRLQEEDGHVAAVLLDLIMPEMDGFGVLEFLSRQEYAGWVPVFLITAETSGEVKLRGYESGVVDVINKPIMDPEIVEKRVNNAVELFESRRRLQQMVDEQVRTIRAQADKLRTTTTSIIDMLSSVIEFRSGESGNHVRRIRSATKILLEYLAEHYPEYELDPTKLEMISEAAAMHDIGKISIPDYILNKPGRLTAEEFEEMKKHTIYGCEMLESIPFFQDEEIYRYAYEICRHHHERWNGKGYPDGLQSNEISIWAQVVSLADVYDALVSKRVYKEPYPREKAVDMILNGECGVFNPALLQAFIEMEPILHEELYTEEDVSAPPVPASARKPEKALAEGTKNIVEQERDKYRFLAELGDELVFDYRAMTDTVEYSPALARLLGQNSRLLHARDTMRRQTLLTEEALERLRRAVERLTPQDTEYRQIIIFSTSPDQEQRRYQLDVRAVWSTDGKTCVGHFGKLTPC